MTDTEPVRVYDPSNPEHLAWWMEQVRRKIAAAAGLPDGITLAWDPPLPRRCESEACDEYDGVHCYGDGCAMTGKEDRP